MIDAPETHCALENTTNDKRNNNKQETINTCIKILTSLCTLAGSCGAHARRRGEEEADDEDLLRLPRDEGWETEDWLAGGNPSCANYKLKGCAPQHLNRPLLSITPEMFHWVHPQAPACMRVSTEQATRHAVLGPIGL